MAKIRWWETKPGGELRFGVDFAPRPGQAEVEEVRRAAYELARTMDTDIDYASLRGQIAEERPDIAEAKIFDQLPDETWVYPGHGDDTTLGAEGPHPEEWRARGW